MGIFGLKYPKRLIKRLLGISRFDGRLSETERHVGEMAQSAYTPMRGVWRTLQTNFYEPQVNLALRDLCRPGMVVFDCGANIGMHSLLMSRLVGPRGIVCAFEASPRNTDMCQNDLVANGCSNVTLYQRALCDRTGDRMPFFYRNDLQADGMIAAAREKPACEVLSLALDDFVAHSGLVPEVVKMDIEGAEFDAIRGFVKTLSQHRPHLIVETLTSDSRVLDFLRKRGYRAIDLNTYREIESPRDYRADTQLRSLLYVHRDRIGKTDFSLPIDDEVHCTLAATDFAVQSTSRIETAEPIALPPGRYVIEVDATALRDEPIECGVLVGGQALAEFRALAGWICSSYREWVIDLARAESITLFASPSTRIHLAGAVVRRMVPLSKPAGWRAFV